MNNTIERHFNNGSINGTISVTMRAGIAKAVVDFYEDDQYWGTKYWIIPSYKTRRVHRILSGTSANWVSLIDNTEMYDLDPSTLVFLDAAYAECLYELLGGYNI